MRAGMEVYHLVNNYPWDTLKSGKPVNVGGSLGAVKHVI